jgi:hypothetical protein
MDPSLNHFPYRSLVVANLNVDRAAPFPNQPCFKSESPRIQRGEFHAVISGQTEKIDSRNPRLP